MTASAEAPRAVWWVRLSAASALLLPALGTVRLALERFVQADEFVFVRCAWLVSEGAVPYRDFFDHHTPLFYLLLGPEVGAAPEDFRAVLAARLFALLLLGALLLVVWRLGRLFGGAGGAWLATLLLATFPPFVSRGIEIRPDLLAALAFLGAGWLLLRETGRPVWSAFVAGALTAAALLSTQKSLYYLWGFAVLALVDLVRSVRGRQGEAMLRRPLVFGLGFATPWALFALWLAWHGALGPFWEQNVALAIDWQSTELTFAASRYLVGYLAGHPLWFLALAGGLAALLARREGGAGLGRRKGAIYTALAVPAVLSLVLNPIPWPYNFLPVFAALAPLTAALVRLRLPGRRLGKPLAVVTAVLALGLWGSWWTGELRRSNRQQRRDLARVLEVTAPDHAVFDDNGGYIFRPAATWYWYHSAAMRELMGDRLAGELVEEILESRAPAWILDFRFWHLPEEVSSFLRWHYQRFDRALFLWGTAYRSTADAPRAELPFLAIEDGEYFVQVDAPEGLPFELTVGGRRALPGMPFPLAAGEHEVKVLRSDEGPVVDFYVLWLPETGEIWRPLQGRPPHHYPYPF